jgi:hypothetical protein
MSADHVRCEAVLARVLDGDGPVRTLLGALREHSCVDGSPGAGAHPAADGAARAMVACVPCRLPCQAFYDAFSGRVSLCENRLPLAGAETHVAKNLAHELVHALDACRGFGHRGPSWDAAAGAGPRPSAEGGAGRTAAARTAAAKRFFESLRDAACTEVRAARLSGDCSAGMELGRGNVRNFISVALAGDENARSASADGCAGLRRCARRRAARSLASARPRCALEDVDEAVDAVFDECFANREPFRD